MKRRSSAYIALTNEGEVKACAPEAAVLLGADSADHVVHRSLADFVRPSAWPRLVRSLRVEPCGLSELWIPTLHGRVLQIRVLDRSKNLYELCDDTPRALLVDATRQAESEQARASLAGSVARELNDPMAIVQGRLELLIEMGAADPERIVRHLKVALGHARRVSGTLHLLRLVGRPAVDDRGVITVRELVQFAIDEAGSHVGPNNIQIDVVPPDMVLAGTTDLLAQVMAHLFGRLDDLCARGGRAWVQARQHDGQIVVQLWALPRGSGVVDPSGGEPAHADPRLDVGVVVPVVARIGGRIEGLRLAGGILFRLSLPLPSLSRSRPRTSDGRAIVVGDAARRAGVSELLKREGFKVFDVADGEEALALLGGEVVDGVVASLTLPGISGLALCREVQRRHAPLVGRAVLVCEHTPQVAPAGVTVCAAPLDRVVLLQALGRRARRRRR